MSIYKDYQNIISTLSFQETSAIKKNFKNGEFIVRGVIKRRDVIIKILPKKNARRVHALKKELLVNNLLEKHNNDLSKSEIINAKIITTGENSKFFWIIRRYYSGGSLAKYHPTSNFLKGYDIIRPSYREQYLDIVEKIADNIDSLRQMTNDFRKIGVAKSVIVKRYLEDFQTSDISKIDHILNINNSKNLKFYSENKSLYLDKKYTAACVGDLAPSNIIITDTGEVVFSDFEWFCFDNYMIDVALLWLFLWKYKKWQNVLVRLMIKNDQDRLFFQLSIIRIILTTMITVFINNNDQEKISNNIIVFKKHVWMRYLQDVSDSYETLIKMK